MEWTAKDVSVYLKNKAYIDTVIVPLIPVDFEKDMQACAREGEYIQLVCKQLERQLAGRVLKCPPFTYLIDTDKETLTEKLGEWDTTLAQNGFAQRYYITSGTVWINAKGMDENIKWIPAIPIEILEQKQLYQLIDDATQSLISEISAQWIKS